MFIGAYRLAILVVSLQGNIPEKFESHWPNGYGGDRIYSNLFRFFYFLARAAILFIGVEPFCQFGRRSSKQHFYEVLMELAEGYRRSWRFKTFFYI